MIVSFLCLIGPGALTCLMRSKSANGTPYAGESAGRTQQKSAGGRSAKPSVIAAFLEVLAYAVVNMTITILLLNPLGEAEVMILPDGMPAVRYGSPAMLLSVVLAAAAGLWGAQIPLPKAAGRKKRVAMYTVAAIAAAGLLASPSGSSPPDVQACAVPVKCNNMFLEDAGLLRTSDGSSYFISVSALASGLGMEYGVKNAGLFRTGYYLGNAGFTVNRMTPGRDFYIRGKELFISLAYLGEDEPFSDIRVQDEPVLADGSSREIIYIDYDPKRFDPGWVSDAGSGEGNADGTVCVSCAEAFAQDDRQGCRVFSMDLQTVTEYQLKKGIRLLESYPDAYLLLRVNQKHHTLKDTQTAEQLRLWIKAAEQTQAAVAERIIPAVPDEDTFAAVMDVYHWKDVVYDLQKSGEFSERDAIAFVCREGIRTVAGDFDGTKELFVHELLERGITTIRYQRP